MDKVDQLYQALKAKALFLGRPLKESEWKEEARVVLREARKPKQSEMSDEEWVASLEAEPSLKGINIRQEIGRAQFWCKQNKRVPTRRFLVNWLNKAEKVVDLKAMGAQHATGLKLPPPEGPDGWRQWLKTELAMMSPEHPAFSQLTAALYNRSWTMLPKSWQERATQNIQRMQTA